MAAAPVAQVHNAMTIRRRLFSQRRRGSGGGGFGAELRNTEGEVHRFRRRLAIASGFVLIAFATLIGRFVYLQVALLLAGCAALVLFVRMIGGAQLPRWTYAVPPIVGALLWPLLTVVLQWPQRPSRSSPHPSFRRFDRRPECPRPLLSNASPCWV